MVIHRTRLGQPERDFTPVRGEAAISLTTRLTVESFALAGIAHVRYARANVPVRFVPRTRPRSSSSTTFATSSSSSTMPGLASSCADGITFAEAIADGDSFNLQGCEIPVIGRSALIKNKRAAGRPQDIADVKALGDE